MGMKPAGICSVGDIAAELVRESKLSRVLLEDLQAGLQPLVRDRRGRDLLVSSEKQIREGFKACLNRASRQEGLQILKESTSRIGLAFGVVESFLKQAEWAADAKPRTQAGAAVRLEE